ncbi:MAG: LLM class flavin-dependent oxidoreductase [Planctomycetaceae bacterium]|nr:LLM class flavin-dependent oxidoreductase [Planctomycetaceae bacterium]
MLPQLQRFRCFLIGSETLLIECAETLLKQGHEILGVVTGAKKVAQWAHSRGLRTLDAGGDYRATLAEQPFDYLFSITHLAIIPADVLALPTKGAINFHDGPLPFYSGLNTPVWALLERAAEYAITWHWMTAGIDAGDVLVQKPVDIAADDTALSLNTKCFQAGIESFGELVGLLMAGGLTPRPQDHSRRRYFGKHDRPVAAGLLDWNRPADELQTLVRALNHGRYRNPIGSAKLRLGGKLFVVDTAIAGAEGTSAPPGVVVSLDERSIHVATGAGVLELRGFRTTCGREIGVAEFVATHGLEVGARFDPSSSEESLALTELQKLLAKHEEYWVSRLSHLDAAAVPYHGDDAPAATPVFSSARQILPADFAVKFAECDAAEAVVCALAAYLARVGEKTSFDVGFADAAVHSLMGDPLTTGWTAAFVPLRLDVDPSQSLTETIRDNARRFAEVRKRKTYFHDALGRYPELHERPEIAVGRHLPIVVDCRDDVESYVPAAGTSLSVVVSPAQGVVRWVYDSASLSSAAFSTIRLQFANFLAGIAADPQTPLAQIELLSPTERQLILRDWNATSVDYRRDAVIHRLFEEQAARTPDAAAVTFENRRLTYAQLNRRANRLAAYLRSLGVGPDAMVGIHLERSENLVTAMLAVLKAGGAYLPLDPNYPAERITFMIDDAQAPVIITENETIDRLPRNHAQVVNLDADGPVIGRCDAHDVASSSAANNLAYVIYTSGSTGKPKGVMIEHRNAVNFFVGMDAVLGYKPGVSPPGVWPAVTSLSFDIHVLELLWTLTRGFEVVVHRDRERIAAQPRSGGRAQHAAQPMDFSLFYFSADSEEHASNKYRLLLEGAKWADEHKFSAVWTPERHFHSFGGLYPNPAVTGAAIAAITKHVQIRAGSVVVPLHHPIRVAEEWQIVDNLSNGRVGVSVAAGWQPNDFVLMPENYKDAKAAMFRDTEIIKRLWRGETVEFAGATGKPLAVQTLPRPIQKELPVWVTTAGNLETYIQAGRIGAHVLTHLLGQSVEELAPKIAAYRQARAEAGYDPHAGIVSLMLHTFVGPDEAHVRATVRGPLKAYLGTSLSLLKQFAWAFPAFKRKTEMSGDKGDDFASLTPEENDALLEFAFERYYETSGLFGDSTRCLEMVDRLKGIGVDDIACLIDFGIATETVIEHLPYLNAVREQANLGAAAAAQGSDVRAGSDDPFADDVTIVDDEQDYSLAALLRRRRATHFQCTPSLARMLLSTEEGRAAVRGLQRFCIGGEALPVDLARDITGLLSGKLINMYGPTETTVWSSSHVVEAPSGPIPIGRPMANTQLYILDGRRKPVPVGVSGELYIAGDGVTRGYLNRAELTAERFVSDPFAATVGARMYRTGDLVRYRADGVVEFLGRTDHQVKIRGHRIELGEIETRLTDHSHVRQCVVMPREPAPGDVRLVAYFVADGAVPADADLRDHVRAKLPEYMVPSHFVALGELPLTPNGKIDRKALPALELAPAASTAEFVAPENEIEQKIAALWQDLLGREQIGVDDNFFDLGGHSLLVVRMHRQLSQAVSVPVALTDLFRFPTIRTLAAHLGGGASSDAVDDGADRAKQRRELMQRRRTARR